MSEPIEDAEVAEARAAILPHLPWLHRKIASILLDGRTPVRIEVPLTFSELFDGAKLLGLHVRRADVEEPEVVSTVGIYDGPFPRWPRKG